MDDLSGRTARFKGGPLDGHAGPVLCTGDGEFIADLLVCPNPGLGPGLLDMLEGKPSFRYHGTIFGIPPHEPVVYTLAIPGSIADGRFVPDDDH